MTIPTASSCSSSSSSCCCCCWNTVSSTAQQKEETQTPEPPNNAVTFHPLSWYTTDVQPQLRLGIVLTGSFVVAWGWDLSLYGISHVLAGVNPLQDEIGFGNNNNDRAPQHGVVVLLLGQYLVVCGAAAWLSQYLQQHQQQQQQQQDESSSSRALFVQGTLAAAVRAVEFFPSPVFAGKLLAWLSSSSSQQQRVTSGSLLTTAACNAAVTAAAAVLAHALPNTTTTTTTAAAAAPWHRFTPIVQNTLGFGLGIAWNVFWQECLVGRGQKNQGPKKEERFHWIGFLAMGGYLAVMFLLTLRVAALKYQFPPPPPVRDTTTTNNNNTINNNPDTASSTPQPTLWQRQVDLATFAMQVVCAFTMVEFLDCYVTHEAWYGNVQALILLVLVSAALQAIVASVDLEALRARQVEQSEDSSSSTDNNNNNNNNKSPACTCLLWIPCLWCCCPWVPVLVILSHMNASDTAALKQDWYALIAMVTGLAASIEASNLVTTAVNALAASFCNAKHCPQPWLLCSLQVVVAALTTVVVLPALGLLCEKTEKDSHSTNASTAGEQQSLLSRSITTTPPPIVHI